jgi:quinol monooxygenase YgiN
MQEAPVMYALVRKAKLAEPGIAEEATRRVREGAVPILLSQPGFLIHLGFVSEGGEAVGASLFDDREAALAALGRLRAWAAASMADLTPGEPEVLHGEVRHHEAPAPGLGAHAEALFVTVREYGGVGPDEEEAIPLLSERFLPAMRSQPGFRGFWAFRDERDPTRAVAVSLWANRGAAMAAHHAVVEITAALRGVFPAPPRITAGAARVAAAPQAAAAERA